MRWSNVYVIITSSPIKHFTFGQSSNDTHGMTVLNEGIQPDTYDRYVAYELGIIQSCPIHFQVITVDLHDAAALMKLQKSRSRHGKISEIMTK